MLDKINNYRDKYFSFSDSDDNNLDEIELIAKIDRFFSSKLASVEDFVEMNNEIKHYKEIKVNIKKVKPKELEIIKEDIKNSRVDKDKQKEELKKALKRGEIDIDTFTQEIEKLGKKSKKTTLVDIKNLKKHYYLP